MQKIVIIGNGISGITAARHIRKRSQSTIIVISKETDYFFSRTALMYIYMGHMRYQDTKPYEDWFWKKNNIELRRAEVTHIDFDKKSLHLIPAGPHTTNEESTRMRYDELVIATGSCPNKFGWPGQDLSNVFGLYSYQDLERLEAISEEIEQAVIVGGGLIGIELAEMLHSRDKEVTMLVREENYWDNVLPPDEAQMVNDQIQRIGIKLHLNTELGEIGGNASGKVTEVRTTSGLVLPCQFVGLTAGVHPNIKWLDSNTPLETDRGILVDEYLATNVPHVYAIGDCAQLRNPPPGRQPIEAVWYVGRIMGETIAHTLTGHRVKYQPGTWFNSAKFINLEYQVYGEVPPVIGPPFESFFWQHATKDAALRMVYHTETRQIIGMNVLGIRWKMDVCTQWIERGATIDQVVQEMRHAHFDPELHKKYYPEIKQQFAKRQNSRIA